MSSALPRSSSPRSPSGDLESIVGASAVPSTRFLSRRSPSESSASRPSESAPRVSHIAHWGSALVDTGEQTRLATTRRIVEMLLFLGYAVWLATAVGRGLTAQPLIDFVTLQPGASEALKKDYLAPVPGVGLLVNLTLVFAGVNTAMAVRQIDDIQPRTLVRIARTLFARKTFAALFAIILLRAVLTSERLTLFELVIPVAVVAAIATNRRDDTRIRWGRTLCIGAAGWRRVLRNYGVHSQLCRQAFRRPPRGGCRLHGRSIVALLLGRRTLIRASLFARGSTKPQMGPCFRSVGTASTSGTRTSTVGPRFCDSMQMSNSTTRVAGSAHWSTLEWQAG